MRIAIPIFDRITALDAVGPYEVLSRMPETEVVFVSSQPGPQRTENRMLALQADRALMDVTDPDVVVVPGGYGTRTLMDDPTFLAWLARVDQATSWTASVCTGALLLGAAGLLKGKRATTHWRVLDRLSEFGAIPVSERVVRDGKILTAAGVSAGIDMALGLVAILHGPALSQAIQLGIEYDPQPPFDSGSTAKASPEIRALVERHAERLA